MGYPVDSSAYTESVIKGFAERTALKKLIGINIKNQRNVHIVRSVKNAENSNSPYN